jgi:hypothetical protein
MTQHSIKTISNTQSVKLTPIKVHSGMDITLQNVSSSGYIYIGDEGVTESNYGYRIQPNHAISFELPGKNSLYAIASAPNMKLAIIQISLEVGQ